MLQRTTVMQVDPIVSFDCANASDTLDMLIEYVSDALPVTDAQYPSLGRHGAGLELEFCLRHSALHFSKTAGRLAAFVVDVDHGKFDRIQALQSIVAASLINSLKLADEIGFSGLEILAEIRGRFAQLEAAE